jgi:phage gp36-like protein
MYCSYSDIIKFRSLTEIIDLVNDENIPYNEINLESPADNCRQRIDEAIKAADAEIDGYLRQRYNLPLADIPVLIKYNSVSLTLEYLYFRRLPASVPESVSADAKTKRQMLKNIAGGFIGIGAETSDSRQAAGNYKNNKENTGRIFNDDMLNRY